MDLFDALEILGIILAVVLVVLFLRKVGIR